MVWIIWGSTADDADADADADAAFNGCVHGAGGRTDAGELAGECQVRGDDKPGGRPWSPYLVR